MLEWLKTEIGYLLEDVRRTVTKGVVLFIAICFIGLFIDKENARETMTYLIVLIILLGIIIYFWYGKDHQCPVCHKRFCIKRVERKVIGREEISVLVKQKQMNSMCQEKGLLSGQKMYAKNAARNFTILMKKIFRKFKEKKSCY